MSLLLLLARIVLVRLDLVWAAELPSTAQIDVAFLLEVGYLEVAQHHQAVVIGIVVVPLVSRRVQEERVIREVVVIVDDEAATAEERVSGAMTLLTAEAPQVRRLTYVR